MPLFLIGFSMVCLGGLGRSPLFKKIIRVDLGDHPLLMVTTGLLILSVEIVGFSWALAIATTLSAACFISGTSGKDAPLSQQIRIARSAFPALLLVFVVRTFIFELYVVPTSSMRPTLEPGDVVLVRKFPESIGPLLSVMGWHPPALHRWDPVVFRQNVSNSSFYVKRLAGVGGDLVRVDGGRVIVNGVAPGLVASTPYSYTNDAGVRRSVVVEKASSADHPFMYVPGASLTAGDGGRVSECSYSPSLVWCKVPAGNVFFLGDNRPESIDSRYWGIVPRSSIVGIPIGVILNIRNLRRCFVRID